METSGLIVKMETGDRVQFNVKNKVEIGILHQFHAPTGGWWVEHELARYYVLKKPQELKLVDKLPTLM